jgi:hypothetical protein
MIQMMRLHSLENLIVSQSVKQPYQKSTPITSPNRFKILSLSDKLLQKVDRAICPASRSRIIKPENLNEVACCKHPRGDRALSRTELADLALGAIVSISL